VIFKAKEEEPIISEEEELAPLIPSYAH
jgi:hypothetical protein